MKILFITQFLPYPLDSGGKIKTYQTIKLLSKRHQIFLISFIEKPADFKWQNHLRKYCFGLKTFITPIITASHKNLKLKMLTGLLNSKPFRVQKYFLKETADFIENLTHKENFDIIYCNHDTSIQYLFSVNQWQSKIKVYDETDISSQGFLSYVGYEGNLLEKIAFLIEAFKFRLYENKIKLFDRILAISELDRKKLIARGLENHKVVVLTPSFKIKPCYRFGSKSILFVGLLSWWPNKDAVLWFARKIYPRIKAKISQVKFIVVGANPPEEIKKLAKKDKSIVITGYVKNISSYYQTAGVLVAPIRAGAGIPIKILDALASGLPVVCTTFAAQGIGESALSLADEESQFADKVCRVLLGKKLADKLSLAGLKFMDSTYNQAASRRLLEVLDNSFLAKFKPRETVARKTPRS